MESGGRHLQRKFDRNCIVTLFLLLAGFAATSESLFSSSSSVQPGKSLTTDWTWSFLVPGCLCNGNGPQNHFFRDTFTGVAGANLSGAPNQLQVLSLDPGGAILGEGLLDFATNQQRALLSRELPGAEPEGCAYFFRGTTGPMQGFFLVGSHDLDRLDGIAGQFRPASRLYLPFVRHNTKAETVFFIFNPRDDTEASIQLDLRDQFGRTIGAKSLQLPPHGSWTGYAGSLLGTGQSAETAYLVLNASSEIVGLELVEDDGSFYGIAGQPGVGGSSFAVPHFFVSPQGSTRLLLLNVSGVSQSIVVRAFVDGGEPSETRLEVNANQLASYELDRLLGSEPSSGHLEVLSADSRELALVGAVLYTGMGDGRYASLLPLRTSGETENWLLHVAQSQPANVFTGLALLNHNELLAEVEMYAFDGSGAVKSETRFSLASGQRRIGQLNDASYFGSSFSQTGGSVRIKSTLPIFSTALFGDFSQKYLAAIETHGRPSSQLDPFRQLTARYEPQRIILGSTISLVAELPGSRPEDFQPEWFLRHPLLTGGVWKSLASNWTASFLTLYLETEYEFLFVVTDGQEWAERQLVVAVRAHWG